MLILLQNTLQGRGGIFAQRRLKATTAERHSTKNIVNITWTGPVVGKGVGEGWGTVADGECLLTCVLTFGCAHAVRKRGGGAGAGGRGCACRREQKGKNVPGHPAGCEFIAVQKAVEAYGTEKA